MIARVAGGEVEGGLGGQQFRGETFHFHQRRRGAVAGPGGGAADAVALGRFARRADHLGTPLQAQVSGADEVQKRPAVDDGLGARRAVHQGVGLLVHGGVKRIW